MDSGKKKFPEVHTKLFEVDGIQIAVSIDRDDSDGWTIYARRWSHRLNRTVTAALNMPDEIAVKVFDDIDHRNIAELAANIDFDAAITELI